ncbi:MAG TPA: cupin [Spirochaeta sp.]|nr:cupin [Spirochaeta sp.]
MPLLKKENMKNMKINMEGALNVSKMSTIDGALGWEGWSMRIFTLKREGYTPFHTHPWPHINYIISGEGSIFIDGKEKSVTPGDTAYINAGEKHQFKNLGEGEFSFICIVPAEGDK